MSHNGLPMIFHATHLAPHPNKNLGNAWLGLLHFQAL
jgi:hypothetical protein